MRIAVHGAGGFTGRLTVAEVRRRGFTPVLVGRNEERLRRSAAAAGAWDAEVRVAGLAEGEALAAAFADCAAVINCAGPFTVLGEPVVRAALAARTHYLDTAGEEGFIREVLDGFHEEAVRAGVAVVPAMTDDGAPGDLIARLVAERVSAAGPVPEVAEILVADLRGRGVASRGTARSMVAVSERAASERVVPERVVPERVVPERVVPERVVPERVVPEREVLGKDVPGPEVSRRGVVDGGGPSVVDTEEGPVDVEAFALPGAVTVPRHVRVRRVRTVIRAEVAALFAALTPDVVDSVPEIPDEAARAASRWLMLAEATGTGGGRARGWVTGSDAYGMTAVIAVEGARRLAEDGAPAGTLAPAQAFDPAGFLDHLTTHGVTWQVTPA
ncbi:saccharopine dehydrogenase NADP-binding domain-containing protein [Nonomuraea fuscirosea]|uniref:saccharopine dehydrogenase NADP-binding domain-containing protein n=1 Tax=Nonomuraea fuscirosea TaxID=1291556 RepID=UPI0033D69D09